MKDYYGILEISPEATQEEVKKAYRVLVLMYHPDRHSHTDNKELTEKAEQKFKLIQEAYEVLSDPEKRAQYDTSYSEAEQRPRYAEYPEDRTVEETYEEKQKESGERAQAEAAVTAFPIKTLYFSLGSLSLALVGLFFRSAGQETLGGWGVLQIALGLGGMAIGGWLLWSHGTTGSRIVGALFLAPAVIIFAIVALTVLIVILVIAGLLLIISRAA